MYNFRISNSKLKNNMAPNLVYFYILVNIFAMFYYQLPAFGYFCKKHFEMECSLY